MAGRDTVLLRAGAPGDGLLEREAELAAIDAALDSARAGQGRLVYVEAHAGLGKSRLLAAAALRAREGGMRVCVAKASELERGHSFGVAIQLFESPLASVEEPEREELLGGAAGLARPLFEGLAAVGASPEDQLFSLLHGLYWLCSNLAEERSLVIVADDAHWIDRPTLRFLLYLAERLDELPVALLTSGRPAEPGAAEDLLRQLKSLPVGDVIHPRALSRTAVARLVESRLPAPDAKFVDACARVTEGNPYLLTDLLADLAQRGVAPTRAAADEVGLLAPESVLDAALVRLARMPSGASALARAVAVLGGEATLQRSAALARLDRKLAAAAADALAAAELLRTGGSLSFVHPLLHSAIYAEIPRAERAVLHANAARLLDEAGVADETVAAHLLAATPAADPWVVDRLRRSAARSLSQGAADSAVCYLTRALDEPPGELRPDVLIELGRAESLAGRASAINRLEQALELSHDPRHSAEILREVGWTLQKSGDLQGAVRAFERGLDALSGLPGDDDATARQLATLRTARLGAALNGGFERGGSERALREVNALLDKSGSALDANERGLLSVIAMGRLFSGERHDEVIALCKHAWGDGALLDTEGSNSQTIWHVIGCLAWADDLVNAEEMTEAALRRAQREGSIVTLALGLYARSWPRYWRGELSGAAADAQAAVDAWSGEYSMYLPVAAYWLALSLLALGQVDEAAHSLDFPDAEERWGQTNLYGPLLAAQAAVDIARGEHKQAVRKAERCGTSVLGSLVINPAVIPWRSYLCAARLGAGDRDGAQQAATEELELSRRFGAPRALGISLRSAGLAAGDKAGLELLEESAHVLRGSPARLELARSLVELGAAKRRGGRPAAAREPLREGLELARGFRAVVLERQAHEELLASGAKPRRRDLTGLDSLTPSERRVAELAASGMTNREIAQTLFVTLKAVQWHLGHTYRKLNISDRKDLPAALNPPASSPIGPDD